jgi:hypothetical protein
LEWEWTSSYYDLLTAELLIAVEYVESLLSLVSVKQRPSAHLLEMERGAVAIAGGSPRLHRWRWLNESLLASNRRSALEAFGCRLEWSIGRVLAVSFGRCYGVRFVVLWRVGRVAQVRFGIEV